jgi:UDPglucose 6-dehydrogenase
MIVAYVGLSHLGIISVVAAAAKGFEVIGYDPDGTLCDELAKGEFPIYEPGLADAYDSNRERITFTADKADLARCRVIYLSIDVRTDDKGQSDLSALNDLFSSIVDSIPDQCCLVVLSQVPPGFTRQLYLSWRDVFDNRPICLYYQVETLVFGLAIGRALSPERIIVGCLDPEDVLLAGFAELLAAFECPVLLMRYESAELSKIAINVCLASTISVSNTLAELCESTGADWYEIMPALKSDKRIGQHAYVTPGLGIGGGNLDRDLVTVCRLGEELGTDVGVIEAFRANSRYRCDWVMKVLREEVMGNKPKPVIAVWGLAYKAGTRSTKDSPALYLIRSAEDCIIRCYDPKVSEPVAEEYCTRYESAIAACRGADALVIMTPWQEFVDVDLSTVGAQMADRVIIDPFRLIDHRASRELGFQHIRLGVSEIEKISRETEPNPGEGEQGA